MWLLVWNSFVVCPVRLFNWHVSTQKKTQSVMDVLRVPQHSCFFFSCGRTHLICFLFISSFFFQKTPSPGPKVEPCSSTPTTPCATTTTTTATATTPVSSSSNNNNNNNSSQRRGRKPDHDDISQEQVLRIYHDELAKMMSGNSSSFNPAAFNPALLTGARSMASNLRDYNR